MHRPPLLRTVEWLGMTVSIATVSALAFFGGEWNLVMLGILFPLMMWATLRGGMHGASGASLLVALIAVWGTINQQSVLAELNSTVSVQVLQAMLAAIATANLVIAAMLTERDHAMGEAQQVAESLERAESLAHLGSWECDLETGTLQWSAELERLLHIRPEIHEANIETITSRVHPTDHDRVAFELDKAITHRAAFEIEHRILDRDAERERTVLHVGTVETDVVTDTPTLYATMLDITERESIERLRESLTTMASFKLRAPLASIVGFADTLNHYWESLSETEVLEMLGIIEDQGIHMKELVDDVLMQSRLDAGALVSNIQHFDAGDLARDVVEELALDDVLVMCPEPVEGVGDPDQLSIALSNIVVNAARHGEPPVIVQVAREAKSLLFRVLDHGDGVPEAFVDEMFDRFVRGPVNGQSGTSGSGLGLSIAQGIVVGMGGSITYHHDEYGWTIFAINVPDLAVPSEIA
jgi:signal transduction histidine kinase